MVEPVRHRQTKEAGTDMFDLQPPRHTSTLPHMFPLYDPGDKWIGFSNVLSMWIVAAIIAVVAAAAVTMF